MARAAKRVSITIQQADRIIEAASLYFVFDHSNPSKQAFQFGHVMGSLNAALGPLQRAIRMRRRSRSRRRK